MAYEGSDSLTGLETTLGFVREGIREMNTEIKASRSDIVALSLKLGSIHGEVIASNAKLVSHMAESDNQFRNLWRILLGTGGILGAGAAGVIKMISGG